MLLDTACGSGHMLALYQSQFDPNRSLIGVDISPKMIAISKKQLDHNAMLVVGDMRSLPFIDSDTIAAVINFFAIHHLDIDGVRTSLREWNRVLVRKGRLLIAAWEGRGTIDYGEESEIVALRYTNNELIEIAEATGFIVNRSTVEPVEDFPMKAIYLECTKE
jgi:ubiquinone/menaquinone biosynthesis C-methylase UbiE